MPDTPKIVDDSESSRSPVQVLADILGREDLTREDKDLIFKFASTRFKHRRRMAYISLFSLIGFSAYKVLIDPEADLAWINGTLAGIIAVYYGASALRPGS